MDAPLYPPATSFEQPVQEPWQLSVYNVSLQELMSSPPAWAIVLQHAPILRMTVATPQIQPQLGNMMVGSFITFGGMVSQASVDAIDQDLRRLPRSDWPKL